MGILARYASVRNVFEFDVEFGFVRLESSMYNVILKLAFAHLQTALDTCNFQRRCHSQRFRNSREQE
jgi:hypothetical protein